MIELRGMTWDHTRGYDPMAATAAHYAATHPDVRITWERRSLQAFADYPIQTLAEQYDLIVIDHPHVGIAARAGCLLALDGVDRPAELRTLASQSLGPSHDTYRFNSHQWALAIDAATQVASFRADRITAAPTNLLEVIELARDGRVIWPIKPVDALMSFFTLCANRGTPCNANGQAALIDRFDGMYVLNIMRILAQAVGEECLSMNPIQAYERLVADDRLAYCPLGYGYTNYARDGYRAQWLAFTDIATLGKSGPIGSTIGGTGIAVSARCAQRDIAVDYAFWIASAPCQHGLYFDAGGQPANVLAWDDDRTNAACHDFFRNTRATLDGTYVRPRYDGYLDFQDAGGTIINRFLAGHGTVVETFAQLQAAYQQSLPPKDNQP